MFKITGVKIDLTIKAGQANWLIIKSLKPTIQAKMQCNEANPEVQTPPMSFIKTRAQSRASQQSHTDAKTEHGSQQASRQASKQVSKQNPKPTSKLTSKKSANLSQDSIAEVLGDEQKAEAIENENLSMDAQAPTTELIATVDCGEKAVINEEQAADVQELPSKFTEPSQPSSQSDVIEKTLSTKKRTLAEITGGPVELVQPASKVRKLDGSCRASKQQNKSSVDAVTDNLAKVTL